MDEIPELTLNWTERLSQIVFRPNDNFKIKWDLIIMILSLFNSFTVPVEMAFQPMFLTSDLIVGLNYFVDMIFFFDILICFRSAYVNDRGEEITDGYLMAKTYL